MREWLGVAFWVVVVVLIIGLAVSGVGSDDEASELSVSCGSVETYYDELVYESERIPAGYDYTVQDGINGWDEVCTVDDTEEEVSREVSMEPVDEMRVYGVRDIPLDAEFWYDDQDVIGEWNPGDHDFEVDFAAEVIEEYCGRYYDDYYCYDY